MTYTLTVDSKTGDIKLPKIWQKKFKTQKFRAYNDQKKLIIEPVDDTPEELLDKNIEIYDGGDGICFKKGLSGESLKYFQKVLRDV